MRTSRKNGTINNTSWYEDPRLPRNGKETMDMDMQDFQIKFDESTIDINDDYRMNVKLIPRVAWKKSLDSKYNSPIWYPQDPGLSLYFFSHFQCANVAYQTAIVEVRAFRTQANPFLPRTSVTRSAVDRPRA